MNRQHSGAILLMLGVLLAVAGYRSGRLRLLADAIQGNVKVVGAGEAAANQASKEALAYLLDPNPGATVSAPGTKPAPLPGAKPITPRGTVPLPGLLTPIDTGGLIGTGPSIGGTGRSGSAG